MTTNYQNSGTAIRKINNRLQPLHPNGGLSTFFDDSDDNDSDAFEKLEKQGSIDGLVVPLQYMDPSTGEITDLWGSLDENGLFDIIDIEGKTHPLMHPLALDACITIAEDWNWIDRNQANTILAAHKSLSDQLHTPQITQILGEHLVAQVMTGYAQLAQRFKVGAYGAMGMDSQGTFTRYVGLSEIKNIFGQAASKNPELQAQLDVLIDTHAGIINTLAGEISESISNQIPNRTSSTSQSSANKKSIAVKQAEFTQHQSNDSPDTVFDRFNVSFNPNNSPGPDWKNTPGMSM